jgi:hypothetical protein
LKILFELNHPGHIHFFKNTIKELKKKKTFEIFLAIREKDINYSIIDDFKNLKILFLGKYESFIGKLLSLLICSLKIFKFSLIHKPDLYIGWNAVYSGIVSKLMRKPFLLFEDNEYTWNQLITRIPFATKIYTSSTFPQYFGKRHIFYESYEEMAYCHPKWIDVDPIINNKYLNRIKKNNRKLITLRLISWNATHDSGQKGLNLLNTKQIANFINKIGDFGAVFLSIEGSKPLLLDKVLGIRQEVDPSKFHDFLYYSDLYIGEGGTTAAEAAIMSVPAIYTSTLLRSYLIELSTKYKLIEVSINKEKIMEIAQTLLFDQERINNFKKEWKKMMDDKIDVNYFILQEIENFSNSKSKSQNK